MGCIPIHRHRLPGYSKDWFLNIKCALSSSLTKQTKRLKHDPWTKCLCSIHKALDSWIRPPPLCKSSVVAHTGNVTIQKAEIEVRSHNEFKTILGYLIPASKNIQIKI